ncbi:MAG TPA: hypothetical protein PLM82_06880 [Candidatus Latescibacteria bacterium]|nr:hypothetical protein [Candidatus Latescibacterota bacterium]
MECSETTAAKGAGQTGGLCTGWEARATRHSHSREGVVRVAHAESRPRQETLAPLRAFA